MIAHRTVLEAVGRSGALVCALALAIHGGPHAVVALAQAPPGGLAAPAAGGRYLAAIVRLLVVSTGVPSATGVLSEEDGDTFADPVRHESLGPGEPAITPDSEVASPVIRHVVATLAVNRLVAAGRLRQEDAVSARLRDFRTAGAGGRPVRVADLVAHWSGLPLEPPPGVTRTDVAGRLSRVAPVAAPGALDKPSRCDTLLLERIVESITGRAYADWVAAEVLAPLGIRGVSVDPAPSPNWFPGDVRTIDGRIDPMRDPPPVSAMVRVSGLADIARALAARPAAVGGSVADGGRIFLSDGSSGATWAIAADPAARRSVVVAIGTGRAEGAASRAARDVLLATGASRTAPSLEVPDDGQPADIRAGTYASGEVRVSIRTAGDLATVTPGGGGRILRFARLETFFVPIDGHEALQVLEDGRVEIGGRTYARRELPKPAAVPLRIREAIGEYGPDGAVVYIFERDGRLAILHDARWIADLFPAGRNAWRIGDGTPLARERVTFVHARGAVGAIRISGRELARRAVGPEAGQAQLRITPVRPVDDLIAEALRASPPAQSGEFLPTDLVELRRIDPAIRLDVRYATTNNFLGSVFYRQARAFLQRPAAEALARAGARLRARGYGLLVHDGYRPWYVTKVFWDATPENQHVFVANPANGSRHNRGCAVDLSLYELATGRTVEMVSTYDETTDRAYPDYPGTTSLQRWHRDLLREAMEAEGFTVYRAEWWHYDFRDWHRYRVENVRFEDIAPAATGPPIDIPPAGR